jgi:hypothetical protein
VIAFYFTVHSLVDAFDRNSNTRLVSHVLLAIS